MSGVSLAWDPAATAPPLRWSRSLVAGVNAEFRARETALPDGQRILSDPWARLFSEGDPRVRLLRAGRWLWPPLRRAARSSN